MRRWLALLLLALPAMGQVDITSAPCKLTDGSCASGGSSLPATTGNDGKVLMVSAGGTATEWAAVAGTGTVTSVGNGTIGPLFAATWATGTTTPALSLDLVAKAANCVIAGPATGVDAVPTCRSLVALDLGNFTLSPTLRLLTLQDATGDTTPLTVRASGGAGTAYIAQFQASNNAALSHIAHDGTFVGNVTGNVSGSSGSCTGNAATATSATTATTATTATSATTATTAGDGLTSASGTAPLTLTLAAKGLTGSVAAMTAASAGSGGAAGLVPASAAGDQAKYLRADATWQTVSGGGGITNSAGANVLTKSDGTNIVATALSEASAGAIATSAGTALGLTATAPAATTGASQAGKAVTITASPAVASTDTAGAAAGGTVNITAGAAARNTSGNANGGDIVLVGGAGIGTGTEGGILIGSAGTGKIYPIANGITIGTNGAQRVYIGGTNTHSANGVFLTSTGAFAINSTATPGSANNDVLYYRRGAGNPAWGVPSGTPPAYTHSLAADSRSGTDTNVGGASATLQPGNGTGTGTAASLIVATPSIVGSGTGAQTQTTRLTISEAGIVPATNFKMPFGAIYWSSPAATSNETDTPIKCAGTTAAQGSAYEVTQATTNRLTYTGTLTHNFMITATVALSAAATNTTSKLHIYKGGSAVTGLTITRFISGSDIGAVAIHGVVSLATNEYLELFCETNDGDDLTVQNGVLSIRAID